MFIPNSSEQDALYDSFASLSVNLTSTLTTAGNYLALFDIFLPVGMLLTTFGIIISIEAGYFSYKVVKWIYNKIPGVT